MTKLPLYGRLVLADGTVLDSGGAGAPGVVTGELVFQTGMVGYQEALTDPSYAGQILVFTYPLIGNYGAGGAACESDRVQPRAAIVHQLHESAGHYASEDDLQAFLAAQGVPVLTGVDTRALVRRIRAHGVMPAALAVAESGAALPSPAALLAQARAGRTTAPPTMCWPPPAVCPPGTRPRILTRPPSRCWITGPRGASWRGCGRSGAGVWVLPAQTTAEQIRSLQPDARPAVERPRRPGNLTMR